MKSITRSCVILTLVIVPGCAEKNSNKVCDEINKVIDEKIRDRAVNNWDGMVNDNTAFQQNARISQNIELALDINNNLSLLQQNNCKPRMSPVDASKYTDAARKCLGAKLELVSASWGSDEKKKKEVEAKIDDACTFSKWKPDK